MVSDHLVIFGVHLSSAIGDITYFMSRDLIRICD